MILICKEALKKLSARTYALIASALILAIIASSSFVFACSKQLSIIDDEKNPIEITTFKGTVGEVLAEAGITLNEGDKSNFSEDEKLADNMQIKVERAIAVNITANGETKTYLTTKRTTLDILKDVGFNAAETDLLTPSFDERLYANADITFVKTSEDIVKEEVEVPFEGIEKKNADVLVGTNKVVQNGENGINELVYKVQYHDGVEASRELVETNTVKEAVAQITEVGTKEKPKEQSAASYAVGGRGVLQASRLGEIRYSKVITCNATAYDLSFASCGKNPGDKGYGITASGMRAQRGVIAVDPRVIPLGTRVYVEAVDGSWVYGNAIAGDTGGAIKGNKVDLFFDTASEVKQFGRRQCKVYILE